MSKLKVGDRVFMRNGPYKGNRGKIVVDDKSEYVCRYIVRFEPPAPQTGDDSYTWADAEDLRCLVKRKRPRPAAPDRVMVAARLLAGMLANPSGPIQSNEQSGWDYVNCSSESLSQVALELADALIAEGAK